jgi:multiple sugar transport system ATP-binding protein
MPDVRVQSLTKVFPGGVKAIDDLTLEIGDGEFFALLGPSGCGKTTLLRTIAGLEAASSGTVAIGDVDVTRLPPGRRDVAMVFQDYALYPHMTIADNIAYPLKIKKVDKAKRQETTTGVAEQLQLTQLLDRRPAQLSGGQQQRAALARAVACRPQVFLFDEPLSNLDARLRLEARTFLKRLQKELGITTVYVTHDQSEALALADRMAVMREGRIRQLGTPREVFLRPANLFVAAFIGSTPMNLLPGTVVDGGIRIGDGVVQSSGSAQALLGDGEEVVLGARPEYTALHREQQPGSIAGSVAVLESLGAETLVMLEAGSLTVQATVPEGDEPAVGESVFAVPDPERSLLYRKESGELVQAAAETAGGEPAVEAPAVSPPAQ